MQVYNGLQKLKAETNGFFWIRPLPNKWTKLGLYRVFLHLTHSIVYFHFLERILNKERGVMNIILKVFLKKL